MQFCVIDIETIPSTTLPKDLIPQFDPSSVKLGNIKDVEKGNQKLQAEKTKFDGALDKKMSLDPNLCEVVCFVVYDSTFNRTAMRTSPDPEVVNDAWNFIKTGYLAHIPLITFNGIAFDLPVLWHSAMRYDIPVSAQMYSDLTKRYDNRYHYDLCEILATWDFGKKKTKPLDFYLKLFGIGEKTGDGSEVYGWWQNKEYDKIREHCEADCRLTAKLFERLKSYIVKEI